MKINLDSKKVFHHNRGKKIVARKQPKKSFNLFRGVKSNFNIFFPKKTTIEDNIFPKPTKKSKTKDPNEKIFKPKKNTISKSKIKENLTINKKNPAKKFQFGYKKITSFGIRIKSFSFKNILNNINYYLVKFGVFDNFNRFMTYTVLAVLSIFVIYISFFDTFFLVKTYSVNYSAGSYLDEAKTDQLIKNIHKDKLLGVIPHNSLWFLNGSNFTLIAKKFNSQVKNIEVQNRIWPNTAILNITTEPILFTLGINENEYWRVSRQGKVVSKDTAGIRENLVTVEKPVIFDKSGSTLTNYDFSVNPQQTNRFWFVNWLWRNLEAKNIPIAQTTFPSLIDNDVIITTKSGVKLYFDAGSISKENQLIRLEEFLTPEKLVEIEKGYYKYIDFRIAKRIFQCPKESVCK